MKQFLIILGTCLFIWFVVNEITALDEQASDGFYEKGFPFIFIREFSGKGDSTHLELGFVYRNFFLDIGLVITIAGLITLVIGFFRRKN